MHKNHISICMVWVLCLLLPGMGAAGLTPSNAQPSQGTLKKENPMHIAVQIKETKQTIPTIDTEVPAVFETASFGLG